MPAALAALQGVVREGNKLLAEGDAADTTRCAAAGVGARDARRARPRPVLARPGRAAAPRADLHGVVDRLVEVALQERAEARTRKDWAAADRVRDALAAAGVLVEDTPTGPRWTLADHVTEETP